jgi:hypothetical protein
VIYFCEAIYFCAWNVFFSRHYQHPLWAGFVLLTRLIAFGLLLPVEILFAVVAILVAVVAVFRNVCFSVLLPQLFFVLRLFEPAVALLETGDLCLGPCATGDLCAAE